jgi:hypothetical protein
VGAGRGRRGRPGRAVCVLRIFQTVVKKIFPAAGAGNGFVASLVNAGLKLTNRLILVASEVKPGISMDASRATLRGQPVSVGVQSSLLGAVGETSAAVNPALALTTSPSTLAAAGTEQKPAISLVKSLRDWWAGSTPLNPGVAMSMLGASGDVGKPAVNAAFALAALMSQFNSSKLPAFKSNLQKVSCVTRTGGNATSEVAVAGRTDWASDANAVSGTNGIHDGSDATFAGNLTAARGGHLILDYAETPFANKHALTIESVKLFFYGNVAGTALNNADVQLRYGLAAGAEPATTLATITGNDAFAATPKEFDITAAVTHWAHLNDLRTGMRANAATGETWTAACDAIEVEVASNLAWIADASGNDHRMYLVGCKDSYLIASVGGFGNRLDFPGTDLDDASAGAVAYDISSVGLTAWTDEFRFRKDRSANETVAAWGAYVGGTFYGIIFSFSAGVLALQYFENDVLITSLATGSALSNANHSTRGVWDGATLYFYVDGALVGSTALASFYSNAEFQAWVGRGPHDPTSPGAGSPRPYDGAVDERRISSVARSTGATYTVDSAPFADNADTIALWHFDALVKA